MADDMMMDGEVKMQEQLTETQNQVQKYAVPVEFPTIHIKNVFGNYIETTKTSAVDITAVLIELFDRVSVLEGKPDDVCGYKHKDFEKMTEQLERMREEVKYLQQEVSYLRQQLQDD